MARKPKEVTETKVNENPSKEGLLNEQLEALKKEYAEFKDRTKMQVEGLLAELEAAKMMYQESLNVTFQLKTQVIILQKKVVSLMQEIADLKKPKG